MRKSVNVLGQKIKIKNMPKKLKETLFGLYNNHEQTIYINADLSSKEKLRTLIHEIGHGLLNRSGVAYTGVLTPEMEEIVVENYANVMIDLIEQLDPEFIDNVIE